VVEAVTDRRRFRRASWQACTVGHEALDLASSMSSARAVAYMDRLVRDLGHWRGDRRVKEFTERARTVMA